MCDSIYVSTKQGKLVKVMEKSQGCLPWCRGEDEGYDWKRTMREDSRKLIKLFLNLGASYTIFVQIDQSVKIHQTIHL